MLWPYRRAKQRMRLFKNPKTQNPNPKPQGLLGFGPWDLGFSAFLTRATLAQLALSFDPVVEVAAVIAAATKISEVGGLGNFVVTRKALIRRIVRGRTHIWRGVDRNGALAARLDS